MNTFYLLNEAIKSTVLAEFKLGISELITVKDSGDENDSFLGHHSIYDLEIWLELFGDPSNEAHNVYMFAEQLKRHPIYIPSIDALNMEFQRTSNAFLGFNFALTGIPAERQVSNISSFNQFKETPRQNLTFRNFWSRREELFPNLILCGEVEEQIAIIGGSGYFNQIVDKLKTMNEVAKKWTVGDFSYIITNRKYPLRISPESEQTMVSYGTQRLFSLPNKTRETFELHIKTGDLRFHFFPDNKTRNIYIGYIGPHLDTVSN